MPVKFSLLELNIWLCSQIKHATRCEHPTPGSADQSSQDLTEGCETQTGFENIYRTQTVNRTDNNIFSLNSKRTCKMDNNSVTALLLALMVDKAFFLNC